MDALEAARDAGAERAAELALQAVPAYQRCAAAFAVNQARMTIDCAAIGADRGENNALDWCLILIVLLAIISVP